MMAVNLTTTSGPAAIENVSSEIIPSEAFEQAAGPGGMSAIQRSSAAHRRLQWFHWCTSPGRRGQIATIAFEADPGLVAHPARNSLPTLHRDQMRTVDFASPFDVKFWNVVRNRNDQLGSEH